MVMPWNDITWHYMDYMPFHAGQDANGMDQARRDNSDKLNQGEREERVRLTWVVSEGQDSKKRAEREVIVRGREWAKDRDSEHRYWLSKYDRASACCSGCFAPSLDTGSLPLLLMTMELVCVHILHIVLHFFVFICIFSIFCILFCILFYIFQHILQIILNKNTFRTYTTCRKYWVCAMVKVHQFSLIS